MSKIAQYSHGHIGSFLEELQKHIQDGHYYDFSEWGRMQSPKSAATAMPTVEMESVKSLPVGGADSGDKELYDGVAVKTFGEFLTDFQKAVHSGKKMDDVLFFPSKSSPYIRVNVLWSPEDDKKKSEPAKKETVTKSETDSEKEQPATKPSKTSKTSKAKS